MNSMSIKDPIAELLDNNNQNLQANLAEMAIKSNHMQQFLGIGGDEDAVFETPPDEMPVDEFQSPGMNYGEDVYNDDIFKDCVSPISTVPQPEKEEHN